MLGKDSETRESLTYPFSNLRVVILKEAFWSLAAVSHVGRVGWELQLVLPMLLFIRVTDEIID